MKREKDWIASMASAFQPHENDMLELFKRAYEKGREDQRAELAALDGFAELWYFVSDEAPHEFQKIVAGHSPSRWLAEAHKLLANRKRPNVRAKPPRAAQEQR